MKAFKLLSFTLCLSSLSLFAKKTNFITAPRAIIEERNISKKSDIHIAFDFGSIVPLSNPYSSIGSPNEEEFRYFISSQYSVELAMALSNKVEAGVKAGFLMFDSRNNISSNPTNPIFHKVKARLIPIEGIVRYFKDYSYWRFEMQGGFGMALGDIEASISTLNTPAVSVGGGSWMGHASVGAAFPWTEFFSIHTRLGYSYLNLGAKVITLSSFQKNLNQSGALHGFYANAQLRYTF